MKKIKKHPVVGIIFLSLLGIFICLVMIFCHFGGFGTGKSADPKIFASFAEPIQNISINNNVSIVALGEASHGNVEFQELKLSVFKILVEKYGVKAFALEGDYGGCEKVNSFIHGGEGTAEEMASAIGFAIYRTKEIAALISYMKQYNQNVKDGSDLCFYGFDMQRYLYSFELLLNECQKLCIDTTKLLKLINEDKWNNEFDYQERKQILNELRQTIHKTIDSEKAIHLVDVLLQNCEFNLVTTQEGGDLRDKLMAQNVLWIQEQEKNRGNNRIFVSAHNMHVAKWASMDSMGKLLSNEIGDAYYVIGTDFYKTCCNLPSGKAQNRTKQILYSRDPLAKAAKIAGFDICWLDFDKASQNTELLNIISSYNYMGSLGEAYSFVMRLIPQSYRMFQPPKELYNSMIYVVDAKPTKILAQSL